VLRAEFSRYVAWSQSAAGQQYLIELYKRHGAKEPRPTLRLLMGARSRTGLDDDGRPSDLLTATNRLPGSMRKRIWLTTVAALSEHQEHQLPLNANVCVRVRDLERSASSKRTVEQPDRAPRQSLSSLPGGT
jgi:hypothetical protein